VAAACYDICTEHRNARFELKDRFYRRVRKIAKNDYYLRRVRSYVCLSVCLSVYPHETTRIPLDGFWWHSTFETFSKIRPENSSFITRRGRIIYIYVCVCVRVYTYIFYIYIYMYVYLTRCRMNCDLRIIRLAPDDPELLRKSRSWSVFKCNPLDVKWNEISVAVLCLARAYRWQKTFWVDSVILV
jgi:hypothetical protein